jgi:hypothetical protein
MLNSCGLPSILIHCSASQHRHDRMCSNGKSFSYRSTAHKLSMNLSVDLCAFNPLSCANFSSLIDRSIDLNESLSIKRWPRTKEKQ